MKYITKVEVRGYKGVGAGSGFIKWFTFSLNEVTHVSIVFYFSDGQVVEIEAIQGKGVIIHRPTVGKEFIVRVADLSEQQSWEAYQLAQSLIGSDYDWKGIWGFVRRKKKHDEFKWFCSELVAYILWRVGLPLSRRKPFQETPATVTDSLVLSLPKDC